jgi:integrase
MANQIRTGNFIVNVNFNLRNQKPANQLTDIHAIVRFNNTKAVISGIEKIEPRYWSVKNQAPKQHAANERASEIDEALAEAKKKIKKVFEEYTKLNLAYPVDIKDFQASCKKRIKNLPDKDIVPQQAKTIPDFLQYVIQVRDEIKANKRVIATGKGKGKPYSKNSHKQYGNLIFNLKEFAIHNPSYQTIQFEDIGMEFYHAFKGYLVLEKGKNPGYFGGLIKTIKSIMNSGIEDGLHVNTKHNGRNFIKETSESDAIYLDNTKLDILFKLDLSNKDGFIMIQKKKVSFTTLDKVRDLFLIACYTGMRFSDFSTIQPGDIQGEYIRIKAAKTGDRIAIPIMANLRATLNKYNGNLPGQISNQKLNEYLKGLGKHTGFTEAVHITKYDKGKEQSVAVSFYTLMSSHTGRRSFATNMFKLGIPTLLIMAITGHTTEKSFLGYIRMGNEDKAQMFMELLKRNELKMVGA